MECYLLMGRGWLKEICAEVKGSRVGLGEGVKRHRNELRLFIFKVLLIYGLPDLKILIAYFFPNLL